MSQGPLCSQNQKGYLACINPTCEKNCFICNTDCTCQNEHESCQTIKWKFINDKLDRNIIKTTTKEFSSFLQSFKQLYQNIIQRFTQAFEHFSTWSEQFGLTEVQQEFFNIIKNKNFKGLTGRNLYKIRTEIKAKSVIKMKSVQTMNQQSQLIKNYAQKLVNQLKGLYNQSKVQKQNSRVTQYDDNIPQLPTIPQSKESHIEPQKQDTNLALKILGLNEKGSKFFSILNSGQLENTINNILRSLIQNKEILEQRIEKFSLTLNDNIQKISFSIKQSNQNIQQIQKQVISTNQTINNISTQLDEFKGIVNQQFKNLKIQQDFNKQEIILMHKFDNHKTNLVLDIQEASEKEFLFKKFDNSRLKQSLKKTIQTQIQVIENRIPTILQRHRQQNLPVERLHQKFVQLEREVNIARTLSNPKINDMMNVYFLSKFFPTATEIKSLKLLYRASQNNFQVTKFWDKCHGKSNTITILKTQFGKIIGGFTPLAWNKTFNTNQQDYDKKSFLFSITQKHKIELLNDKSANAIYHYSTKNNGPIFGGPTHDLIICDLANKTAGSSANIGNTYNNGYYIVNNQESYKKISGQISGNTFLIQEWEVYEVSFCQ